ncbi:hypothetical protein LIER_20099 [Lithospermum erythrorhizon]|uniref:Uncharacterized protein n=1 Tax=Lithospermum erythrorhizon TaxID=34254 RepID=A0AAV3QLS0_LITER
MLPRKDDELTKKLEGLALPPTQLEKVVSMPLKGFVPPKVEHGTMGPKAYDLLVKAGYDPKEGKALGDFPPKVTGDKWKSVFERLGEPTSNPIKEQSEEEQSSASCFSIEEGNEGIPDRSTFLAGQVLRGPHPWEEMN